MDSSDLTPITSTDAPAALRRDFSRRSLLKGLGATGLGALLGPALLGMQHADAATPNRATRRAIDKATPKPKKSKLGATSGGLTTPYTLRASTELSEDHFLTDTIQMGASDELVPFTNPYTKQVEAIVLSGGTVSHLQRDPSAIGGWTLAGLDLDGDYGWTTVQQVGVAANDKAAYLFADLGNEAESPFALYYLSSATGWTDSSIAEWSDLGIGFDPDSPTLPTLGALKGGIDINNSCYFYSLVTMPDGSQQIMAWTTFLEGQEVAVGAQLVNSVPAGTTVDDYFVLMDTSSANQNPVGYYLQLAGGWLKVYDQSAYVSQTTAQFTNGNDNAGAQNVTALLAAWLPSSKAAGIPAYVFQTATTTYFVEGDGSDSASLTDSPIQTKNSVAVWTGVQNVVNLLDQNDTLNTVVETAPPSGGDAGTWSTPITLVDGLASIFTVPTDPSQSTMFAIDLDGALSVLTLDTVSGWTQNKLHTASASRIQINSYRTKIAVVDANGIPAAGAQVQVSSDRPVGIWQTTGSSYMTPVAPMTFTADASGEITFSTPAEELDSAVFTATVLDGSAKPASLGIIPDTDVRYFLAGSGSLSSAGSMDGGNALLQAKNSAGGDLFPGLTSLSGDEQKNTVKGAVTSMGAFLSAGSTGAPAAGETQSVQIDMTGTTPAISTSTSAAAYAALPHVSGLQFSFSHLFSTIGHAIRHGVAKMTHLVVQWSREAGAWLVNIGADIAGALKSFENLVITDMKDAFHAIGGFFQSLGADIEEAINWLKTNVLDLLKAAWTNAGTIASFIGSAPSAMGAHVKKFETTGDTFFADLEDDATTLLGNVEKAVTGMTLTSPAPQPAVSTGTGSADSQSKLLTDVGEFTKVINDSPGKWLWDKISNDMPSIISLGVPTLPSGNYEQPLEDLADAWNDAQQLIDDIVKFAQDTFTDLFGTSNDSASTASMPAMFDAMINDADNIILTFLQMCDKLFDFVMDIVILALDDMGDLLTESFKIVSPTSLLGYILDDLLKIDVSMSLAEIAGFAVAFPATLVSKIVGNGDTMPPIPALPPPTTDEGTAAGSLGESDTAKLWLGIVGGTTQCIWGLADIIGDVQTLAGANGKRGEQSGLINFIDVVAPLAESAFLFPINQKLEKKLVPPIVITALLPSVFGALGFIKWDKVTAKVKSIPEGGGDAVIDYFGPVLQSFSGVANTALSVAFQAVNDDTVAVDYAGTVLGNLSFMLAVFGTMWLNAGTDDIPVLVKTVVDAIGNVGAAVCIYESTTLPPK